MTTEPEIDKAGKNTQSREAGMAAGIDGSQWERRRAYEAHPPGGPNATSKAIEFLPQLSTSDQPAASWVYIQFRILTLCFLENKAARLAEVTCDFRPFQLMQPPKPTNAGTGPACSCAPCPASYFFGTGNSSAEGVR